MEHTSQSLIFLLSRLYPKEEAIVCMYFGINEERRYDLNEIAQRFSVTKYRIKQVFHNALAKILFVSCCETQDVRIHEGFEIFKKAIFSLSSQETRELSLGYLDLKNDWTAS